MVRWNQNRAFNQVSWIWFQPGRSAAQRALAQGTESAGETIGGWGGFAKDDDLARNTSVAGRCLSCKEMGRCCGRQSNLVRDLLDDFAPQQSRSLAGGGEFFFKSGLFQARKCPRSQEGDAEFGRRASEATARAVTTSNCADTRDGEPVLRRDLHTQRRFYDPKSGDQPFKPGLFFRWLRGRQYPIR